MKNLVKILVFSLISHFSFCQQSEEGAKWLNEDPAYKAEVRGESNGNTVRIDITCSGDNPADIIKESIKSAIYMLIFQGFEPGANGEPSVNKLCEEVGLYQLKKGEFDAYLNDPQQGQIQGQAAINMSKPPSEMKIEKKKLQKATYTVSVNLENLRKDLEGRKLIKPANQSSTGYKPNVVILPSDAWMKKNGFHKTKDNQGITVDLYDYNNALDKDEMQKALGEIKSKFESNFKIISFKDKVAEIAKEEAKNNALSVSKQVSPLDIYAKVLAADLWIKVNIDTKGTVEKQKFVSVEAYNPFTGNNAFTGRIIDKTTTGSNDWEITKNAIREACDDVKPRFTDFFTKRETEGIEGRITCTISESAGELNFATTFPFKNQQVSLEKLIVASINKMTVKTKDGVYRMNPDGDQTSTLLRFKDVFIAPFIEVEELDLDAEEDAPAKKVMSSNNYGNVGSKVAADLKSKFKVKCEVYQRGLGNVEIVITGQE